VQAVRNVALPGFARLDSRSSANNFVSSFALVLTAGLFVAALLAPLAEPLVNFVYGPRWLGSAGALGVLAVFGAFRVVFDLMATFLIARGGSRPVLLVQVAWVAALVPVMIVGVHAWGIAGAGVAHLVVACTVVFPAYMLALSRHSVPFLGLARAATRPVLAALVAGAAVWASSRASDVAWRALVLGGSVGVLVYLPLLHRWLRGRVSGGWRQPEPEQLSVPVG
jgi:PST family polysaccharide transporter